MTVVCTTAEGHYLDGAAGLINSLYAAGYRGEIIVAYRGELPVWVRGPRLTCSAAGASQFSAADGLTVTFRDTPGTGNLCFEKPKLIRDLLAGMNSPEDAVFYFDADITVKAEWPFFERWAHCGVALVLDMVAPYMLPDDPLKLAWAEYLTRWSFPNVHAQSGHVNAGYIGITRANLEFLDVWLKILEKLWEEGVDPAALKNSSRVSPFHNVDQDALNMTLLASDAPLSRVGPEGMDFGSGGYVMSHAAGPVKPWKRRFVREALGGKPPTLADKNFFLHTTHPVQLLQEGQLKARRRELLVARALGRLIRRS